MNGSPGLRRKGLPELAHRLLETCGRLAQRHPLSWKLAWEAVHRLPFLLPHDKSYNALRHFVAASPSGLFLDVGANDGISALSFRQFSKDYRILSLEPNPFLKPALKRLKMRDPRFDYRIVGAGVASAHVRLFMPVYRGIILHTFTSGSREQVQHAIAESFGETIARRTVIESVEADIVSLDELAIVPTILKIDAEGFDYDVLRGAAETIARSRPFIMIEVAWGERAPITDFLKSASYALVGYDSSTDNFHLEGHDANNRTSGQRNLFGIPREKLQDLPVDR